MGRVPPQVPLRITEDAKRRFIQNADFWAQPDSSRQPGAPEWRDPAGPRIEDLPVLRMAWGILAACAVGVLLLAILVVLIH